MFKITKMPVLVIGAPRTGTTVLSEWILKKNPEITQSFFDPTIPKFKDRYEKFISYANNNSNKDYLVKANGINYIEFPSWFREKIIAKEVFIIKNQRLNVEKQIASYFIAQSRKTWYYNKKNLDKFNDSVIAIDTELLDYSIKNVFGDNEIVKEIPADISVIYENIQDNITEDTYCIKTPLPSNYQEILNIIKTRIS
jgi:hypothetical protein